jgi:hypothetical protein
VALAPATSRNPGFDAGLIAVTASRDRRSFPVAARAPAGPGRRGSKTSAGRNRRKRAWPASSHIRPWCNKLDLDRDAAVSEGRNADIESIADLQALDEILAKIEVDPDVGQIDQGNERHARRYIFARLDIALIDLRGYGSIDLELIDDRLNALDIGIGLFDVGLAIARSSFV